MAAPCEQNFALNIHEIVFNKIQLLVHLAGAPLDESVLDSVFGLRAPEPSHQHHHSSQVNSSKVNKQPKSILHIFFFLLSMAFMQHISVVKKISLCSTAVIIETHTKKKKII